MLSASKKAPMEHKLFTIGHSTRSLVELVELLSDNGVRLLVDVRTIPRSRTNPQFNREKLKAELPSKHDTTYVWLGKELGGLRKRNKSSELNAGWDNASFRGYADYMQTLEFKVGVQQLMHLAGSQGPAAIMCAEMMYFSCHRSLVSDALTVRAWQVAHITNKGKAPIPHKLTKFAHVEGETITYPAYQHTPKAAKTRQQKHASAAAQEEEQAAPEGTAAEPGHALPAAAETLTKGSPKKRKRVGSVSSEHRKQLHVDAMLTRARAKAVQGAPT